MRCATSRGLPRGRSRRARAGVRTRRARVGPRGRAHGATSNTGHIATRLQRPCAWIVLGRRAVTKPAARPRAGGGPTSTRPARCSCATPSAPESGAPDVAWRSAPGSASRRRRADEPARRGLRAAAHRRAVDQELGRARVGVEVELVAVGAQLQQHAVQQRDGQPPEGVGVDRGIELPARLRRASELREARSQFVDPARTAAFSARLRCCSPTRWGKTRARCSGVPKSTDR